MTNKEFTVNVDIRLFAKDEQDVCNKVSGILHQWKHWIGEVTDESKEVFSKDKEAK